MLVDDLKTLLATQYAFVIKAQFFHWNVEGSDFAQLHEFFGDIYEEVYDNSIDRTAEFIRILDDYTPGSFERFAELSQVPGLCCLRLQIGVLRRLLRFDLGHRRENTRVVLLAVGLVVLRDKLMERSQADHPVAIPLLVVAEQPEQRARGVLEHTQVARMHRIDCNVIDDKPGRAKQSRDARAGGEARCHVGDVRDARGPVWGLRAEVPGTEWPG